MTTKDSSDFTILFNLAEKQDKFEHDYSSELVTRISLFLVFAGFVSAANLNLFGMIIEPNEKVQVYWHLNVPMILLSVSTTSLFAAMVILLRAALLKGYSVAANVNEYRKKYKELVSSLDGDTEKAGADLQEWILDATAEAIDKNATRNEKRANSISGASRLLLIAIISLFMTLAIFFFPICGR